MNQIQQSPEINQTLQSRSETEIEAEEELYNSATDGYDEEFYMAQLDLGGVDRE